jgi:hypothetical protein
MMRSTGVRLVDTIQQRARFFGYKDKYAPTCRAWLQPDLDSAFQDYVRHERALRSSLEPIEKEGKPLREWKRIFLLDPRFQMTRRAARRLTLDQFRLDGDGWCLQQWYVKDELDLLIQNRKLVAAFIAGFAFADAADISGDTAATQHRMALAPTNELRGLLAALAVSSDDSRRFTALGLLLAAAEEDFPETAQQCTVVAIADGKVPRRQRAVDWMDQKVQDVGKVALHQGRNPRQGTLRYRGDNKARDDEHITLQIHRLDLRRTPDGPLLADAVDLPFLGVYVPPDLRAGVAQER